MAQHIKDGIVHRFAFHSILKSSTLCTHIYAEIIHDHMLFITLLWLYMYISILQLYIIIILLFHLDVDECALGIDNCTMSQRCVNRDGSYTCEQCKSLHHLSESLQ